MRKSLLTTPADRKGWIQAATYSFKETWDIQMATIHYNILMDQIDIAVEVLQGISEDRWGEEGNILKAQEVLLKLQSSVDKTPIPRS